MEVLDSISGNIVFTVDFYSLLFNTLCIVLSSLSSVFLLKLISLIFYSKELLFS